MNRNLIFIAIFAISQTGRAGDLQLVVNSEPAGAHIYIKGSNEKYFPPGQVSVGMTPSKFKKYSFIDAEGNSKEFRFTDLSKDDFFQVLIEKEGYEPMTLTSPPYFHNVKLKQIKNAKTTTDSNVVVQKNTGFVTISSDPVGARIYINNELLGNTPYTFEEKAGHYQLILKFPGKNTVQENIVIHAGKTRALEFLLTEGGATSTAKVFEKTPIVAEKQSEKYTEKYQEKYQEKYKEKYQENYKAKLEQQKENAKEKIQSQHAQDQQPQAPEQQTQQPQQQQQSQSKTAREPVKSKHSELSGSSERNANSGGNNSNNSNNSASSDDNTKSAAKDSGDSNAAEQIPDKKSGELAMPSTPSAPSTPDMSIPGGVQSGSGAPQSVQKSWGGGSNTARNPSDVKGGAADKAMSMPAKPIGKPNGKSVSSKNQTH